MGKGTIATNKYHHHNNPTQTASFPNQRLGLIIHLSLNELAVPQTNHNFKLLQQSYKHDRGADPQKQNDEGPIK